MSFLKKLFGGEKTKATYEPMRGMEPIQSQGEQDASRAKMEAEMAADQARRRDNAAKLPNQET